MSMKSIVIDACEKGDKGLRAKKELYLMFSQKIYNLNLRITGSEFDAEDATVRTFENAFRNIASLKNPDYFGTWLYRIAINVSRNIRKSAHRQELELNDGMKAPGCDEPDIQKQNEMKEQLDGAMKKLENMDREILLLREYDGKSYEEIAEILGVRIGTVRSRLSRAREALRKALEKSGIAEQFISQARAES